MNNYFNKITSRTNQIAVDHGNKIAATAFSLAGLIYGLKGHIQMASLHVSVGMMFVGRGNDSPDSIVTPKRPSP